MSAKDRFTKLISEWEKAKLNCEICSMVYERSPGQVTDVCGEECQRSWDEVEIDHKEKSDALWGNLIDKKRHSVVYKKAEELIATYDPGDWIPEKVDEWTECGYVYSEKYIKTTPVYKWLLKEIPGIVNLGKRSNFSYYLFWSYLEKLYKKGEKK